MTDYKICGITGHRPDGFPWDYNDKTCNAHKDYLSTMENYIVKLITEEGFNYFITGGAIGVDSDFIEIVLRLRNTRFPDIKLEIAVPCENQELKWNKDDKLRYHKFLEQADYVNVQGKGYTPFCMQKRNEYMVKKSHFFIAFWNGEKKGGTWHTIHYMEKKHFDFELFSLSQFTDSSKAVADFLESLLYSDPEKIKFFYERMKNTEDTPPVPKVRK